MRPTPTRGAGWPLATALALALAVSATSTARGEDSPEVARQKAIRKAQDALIAAAKQGDVQQVQALLQQGTDVNARDGSQRTALFHAVHGGRPAVVRALVEAHADLDARDLDGRTALMEAARRPDAQPSIDLVAAGADVNLADKRGWTALMEAAREGTLAAARAIVHAPRQISLDVVAREDSALSLAAGRGRTALVRVLIAAGVGVRKPEIGGRALKIAADEGYVEVVLALMEAHAPLGFTAWEGELPLHAAAARGQQKIVELLLEGGVDPDEADKAGQTALMKAAVGGHEQAAATLLRLGASADLADREEWTPLMHAAAHSSSGSVGVIRDLLRTGARVNRRAGRDGRTALMIAAEKDNELAVDELLRAGADAQLQSGGKTALALALAEGNKRCAERLGYTEPKTRH